MIIVFAEPATQPDFYRDPLWQFIGVILGLIAIVATVIIFYLQRQKKSLAYEIQTNTPVLTVDEQVAGKVKVSYDDKPIKNAQLIVIKLINNGNQPITSNDYERNFSCKFGDKSKILSSEFIETHPKKLSPKLIPNETCENQIILEPLLLNKGDYLVIKTLVADFEDEIDIDARIIGVSKILQIDESSDTISLRKAAILLFIMSLITFISAILFPLYLYLFITISSAFIIIWFGNLSPKLRQYKGGKIN